MDEKIKEQVAAGKVAPKDLPAGAAREEAKAIATDALAAKVEQSAEQGGTIDPEALEEDREILQHFNLEFNMFEVTDAEPGFHYLFCLDDPMKINEAKTRARQYLGAPHTGFQIVSGDMPECIEYKDPRGYRVIGDTVLMRIPDKEYELIQRAAKRLNDMRNSPDAVQLLAVAEKFRRQVGDKVAAHVISGQTPRDYFKNTGPQNRGRRGITVS
jgi:hypothetical protein